VTASRTSAVPARSGVFATPESERFLTAANAVTAVRTLAAVGIGLTAAAAGSLSLLLVSLLVYWVGDVADGAVVRWTRRETRVGAVFDILSDRLCAAAFYIGLVWIYPGLWLAVAVYLTQFMVVDAFLSLAFLAWPLSSPNYFYVVDRPIWLWNWSKPAKALNSAAFAVLLVLTHNVWLGTAVAAGLLALKACSLVRLGRLGIPIPGGRDAPSA
jgi:CDP-diacylglycerol---glycerol-3-phosphate 3-phosphatidyltransferase